MAPSLFSLFVSPTVTWTIIEPLRVQKNKQKLPSPLLQKSALKVKKPSPKKHHTFFCWEEKKATVFPKQTKQLQRKTCYFQISVRSKKGDSKNNKELTSSQLDMF